MDGRAPFPCSSHSECRLQAKDHVAVSESVKSVGEAAVSHAVLLAVNSFGFLPYYLIQFAPCADCITYNYFKTELFSGLVRCAAVSVSTQADCDRSQNRYRFCKE